MSFEDDPADDTGRQFAEDAFCLACVTGDAAAVRRMLRAEPTLVGATGQVHPDHRDHMRTFGADAGWSPLHLAAHYGHPEVVRALLDAGADPEVLSQNLIGNRPLAAAVAGGNPDVVRALLQGGANPNGGDAGRLTPLHLAANDRQHDILHILLAAGADPTRTDKKGRTPAALAREAGDELGAAILTPPTPTPPRAPV